MKLPHTRQPQWRLTVSRILALFNALRFPICAGDRKHEENQSSTIRACRTWRTHMHMADMEIRAHGKWVAWSGEPERKCRRIEIEKARKRERGDVRRARAHTHTPWWRCCDSRTDKMKNCNDIECCVSKRKYDLNFKYLIVITNHILKIFMNDMSCVLAMDLGMCICTLALTQICIACTYGQPRRLRCGPVHTDNIVWIASTSVVRDLSLPDDYYSLKNPKVHTFNERRGKFFFLAPHCVQTIISFKFVMFAQCNNRVCALYRVAMLILIIIII